MVDCRGRLDEAAAPENRSAHIRKKPVGTGRTSASLFHLTRFDRH